MSIAFAHMRWKRTNYRNDAKTNNNTNMELENGIAFYAHTLKIALTTSFGYSEEALSSQQMEIDKWFIIIFIPFLHLRHQFGFFSLTKPTTATTNGLWKDFIRLFFFLLVVVWRFCINLSCVCIAGMLSHCVMGLLELNSVSSSILIPFESIVINIPDTSSSSSSSSQYYSCYLCLFYSLVELVAYHLLISQCPMCYLWKVKESNEWFDIIDIIFYHWWPKSSI